MDTMADDMEIIEDGRDEKEKCCRCFFCPRLSPVPFCAFVFLTILAAIPDALYIAAFTKIGYGLDVFSFIDNEMKTYAQYVGGVVIIYTMILYLTDCYHWASYTAMVARRYLLTILAGGALLFVISIAGNHPYGPIGIILIVMTAWIVRV